MGCEELYITRIQGGIRGIRMGTKTPEVADVGKWLTKLKPLNLMMHDDLLTKYVNVYKDFQNRRK